MKLQRKLGSNSWTDVNENFISKVVEFEKELSEGYLGRPRLTTTEEVLGRLANGEELRFDTDWNDKIRDTDAITTNKPVIEIVKCACGHSISKNLVMAASSGSSCPNCFDRMSD